MDARADALFHDSNEHVGGDHRIGRITMAEAEVAVEWLDANSPGWDHELFIQSSEPAADFGIDGKELNPQVTEGSFATAVAALFPYRLVSNMVDASDESPSGTALQAPKPSRRSRAETINTSNVTMPRLIFERIRAVWAKFTQR